VPCPPGGSTVEGASLSDLSAPDMASSRIFNQFTSAIILLVLIVLVFVLLTTDPASPLRAAVTSFLPGKRGPEEQGTSRERGVCEAGHESDTRMRMVSLRVTQRSLCDSGSNLVAGWLWETPAKDGKSLHPQSFGWSLTIGE
jgi:hypothetical protein